MAQGPTRERILDAAETLFAEHGFAETSLRAITGRAGVNLAAVNYHFGSKETLIQAIFERFLDPLSRALGAELDTREETGLSLEALLALVSRTALQAQDGNARRLAVLFRLAGLAYIQGQGHMRRFLRDRYGPLFQRLAHLLALAAPEVPPRELFWRLHFSLGATMFALSGMESLRAISDAEFGGGQTPEEIHQLLLDFLAGGIQAPGTAS